MRAVLKRLAYNPIDTRFNWEKRKEIKNLQVDKFRSEVYNMNKLI